MTITSANQAHKLTKELSSRSLSPLDIDVLRALLIFHEHRYYVLNDPIISDKEYDVVYKGLEQLEKENPALITPDSPTQRVSPDLSEDMDNVTHLTPMLSLANSYNEDDLNTFDTQIKKLALIPEEEEVEYAVELKFDGGTIALVYENDLLTRAATRGNGVAGEEITANAKAMRSIPLKALFSSVGMEKVELRGESLIKKSYFDALNIARGKEGKSLFANPRNAATGGLRMKDPKMVQERGLDTFVYQLGYAVDKEGNDILGQFESHSQLLDLLTDYGFKVPQKGRKTCKNISEVHEFCQYWETHRDEYPYEIDGMVIKVNSLKIQEACGYTAHHPRWAIAYKFKAKQATSKLIAIEYQVGKTGAITPVAKIEPVFLAGVTVSSISLHNEEFISSRDIRINDTVLVERAGDVIPYIVKSFPELREEHSEPVVFPKQCPINDTENAVALDRPEGEAKWRCPDCVCGAQDLQRMIFHVSKNAMDIDGLGKSVVEQFYDRGWLKDIGDVYNLDYDIISELEGFGERSVTKLKASIDKAKGNPLHRLLVSLSILNVGRKTSKLLAQEIDNIFDLQEWTLDQYVAIKDVGPIVAEEIIAWLAIEKNIELLKRMESYGVNMLQLEADRPIKVSEDAAFYGKTILFTGSLKLMGRKQAQEAAVKAGAKVASSVSKNLNILVVGEKAGSKLKKAEAQGTVDIMTEEQFVQLING